MVPLLLKLLTVPRILRASFPLCFHRFSCFQIICIRFVRRCFPLFRRGIAGLARTVPRACVLIAAQFSRYARSPGIVLSDNNGPGNVFS